MHKIFRAMRSEKGFTLIELLVVIGILALLAGVVTIGVTQFIGRGAHEAACTDRGDLYGDRRRSDGGGREKTD